MKNKEIFKIVVTIIVILITLAILMIIARRISACRTEKQTTQKSIGSLPPAQPSKDTDDKSKIPKKEKRKKVRTHIQERTHLSAPILRCYDYFEFPKEGGFHVKTCGIPSAPSPTKLFIQWFPVDGASGYNVYLNKGNEVSTNNYQDRKVVSASSHFFESDLLTADGCWSIMVTAIDAQAVESLGSQIYTTCSSSDPR